MAATIPRRGSAGANDTNMPIASLFSTTSERGKQPEPPEAGPGGGDQVNQTNAEPRIMPISGGDFEQSYNAQAAVDTKTMRVVWNSAKRRMDGVWVHDAHQMAGSRSGYRPGEAKGGH